MVRIKYCCIEKSNGRGRSTSSFVGICRTETRFLNSNVPLLKRYITYKYYTHFRRRFIFPFILIKQVISTCITYRYNVSEHEEKQNKFRALRNRQDLFQEEGILNLILEAIDKINIMTSQGFMVTLASDESGQNWDIVSGYLYQLLGEFTVPLRSCNLCDECLKL